MPLTCSPFCHFSRAVCAAAVLLAASDALAQHAEHTDHAHHAAETRSLIPDTALTGWHADVPDAHTNPHTNPDIKPSFVVRDGMLVSMGSPQGHLITDEPHADYRLDIEYRFTDTPGNCGVLVHVSTPRALYSMFPQSIEVQMHSGNAGDFWCIEENIAVDNMADRRNGDPSTWGGSEGQSRRVLNMTDDSENPVGEWNRMIIECLGDRVRVWVNGDLVNDGYHCTASKGRIAIQAEGTPVEFRRLDLTPITELSPAEDRADGKIEEDAAPDADDRTRLE